MIFSNLRKSQQQTISIFSEPPPPQETTASQFPSTGSGSDDEAHGWNLLHRDAQHIGCQEPKNADSNTQEPKI